jgi:hypothetical protein
MWEILCTAVHIYVPKWGSLITLQVNVIWQESLMSESKTEIKIWICVMENDSDPEVYDQY